MYRFAVIILIFFYSHSNLNAEMINSVKIEGNNKISNETIKIYGNIQLDKNYSDIDLNRILNNLYETDFEECFSGYQWTYRTNTCTAAAT